MGKDGDNRDDGVSHFTIPSGPELRHESFELPVGEIKSEHTGRRLARTPPLRNVALSSILSFCPDVCEIVVRTSRDRLL